LILGSDDGLGRDDPQRRSAKARPRLMAQLDPRVLALRTIARDLARVRALAEAEGFAMLAYLIDLAIAEAESELRVEEG
jgi:hypothetical protein